MDILIAISTQDDSRKFDLFTRLYSYFSVEHDPAVFSPSRNNECKNVDHFATWVDGVYLPSEQIAEEDTDVIAGSNAIPYDKGIYFEKMLLKERPVKRKLLPTLIQRNKGCTICTPYFSENLLFL